MKIPIKKYVMDEKLSWEERYKKLEEHHQLETQFLIEQVELLEIENERLDEEIHELRMSID